MKKLYKYGQPPVWDVNGKKKCNHRSKTPKIREIRLKFKLKGKGFFVETQEHRCGKGD